jgi:hypothetical protein
MAKFNIIVAQELSKLYPVTVLKNDLLVAHIGIGLVSVSQESDDLYSVGVATIDGANDLVDALMPNWRRYAEFGVTLLFGPMRSDRLYRLLDELSKIAFQDMVPDAKTS